MQHMRGTGRARSVRSALGVLGLAAGLALLAAPEALAKDEFERGFKDELGRIAAHEAAYLGHGLLAVLVHQPYRRHETVYVERRRHRDYDYEYRRDRDRYDRERQHGYYRYPRQRGYHRGWRHHHHHHVHHHHVHYDGCHH